MPRQPRKPSGTGIHNIMMRGINHQNIFEDAEDYYQFITTLDRMRHRYDDDQIMLMIKTKTGTTNSSAFQQLDESIKQQVFLDLKDCGASLRQLERLTGIGKGVIHRIWTTR